MPCWRNMKSRRFSLLLGIAMLLCSACTGAVATPVYVENHDTSAYMTATRVEDVQQLFEDEAVRKNISDQKTLIHVHVTVKGASDSSFPFHRGNFSLYLPASGSMLDESPVATELFQSTHIVHSTLIARDEVIEGDLYFEVDKNSAVHDAQLRYESVSREQRSTLYQLW